MDGYINKCMWGGGCVNGLEQHASLVLIEELGCFINVVVGTSIGSAHDHDGQARRGG